MRNDNCSKNKLTFGVIKRLKCTSASKKIHYVTLPALGCTTAPFGQTLMSRIPRCGVDQIGCTRIFLIYPHVQDVQACSNSCSQAVSICER